MKIKILLFLLLVMSVIVPCHAYAASIFFGVHSKHVALGEKFQVGAFLDTRQESANAIEGKVLFPADSLEFEGFYNGSSIINFWVQQPALIASGAVSFSGIVPGGFVGSKGYLFTLIFKSVKEGNIAIATDQEKILLNDGQGSEASITEAPLALSIAKQTQANGFVPLYDATPPEPFAPQVGRDPNVFGGKYFLAFAAQDKSSGIDHYEVMEAGQLGSWKSLFSKNQFVRAESPYLLQDQALKSDLLVEAVDQAGNERIAKLQAPHSLALYENYFFWSIIIAMSIIFFGYRLWRKNRS